MFLLLALFSIFSLPVQAEPVAQNHSDDRFAKFGVALDPWAEDQISFWFRVYTEYTTHDLVLHDTVNLKHVYEVIHSADVTSAEREKKKVRGILLRIYEKNLTRKTVNTEALTPEERKYFEILEGNEDPRAYEFAADRERMRLQAGQRDRLEKAYSISRIYLPRMEEMFMEEGVPKELTLLPFVESGFINVAKSSVGALGIWQFMPKTAMKDLRVTDAIDERYDPLKSTRAAARFLKKNHDLLKNWALAIMAYHHGPGLVLKAVQRLKTHDPVRILHLFKHPDFQFASRNYLFEFLAMNDVHEVKDLAYQLKPLQKLPDFITVSFPRPVRVQQITRDFPGSAADLQLLNPHFRKSIWSGEREIPAHYPVRLPGVSLDEFKRKTRGESSR